jgi:hypothetical protein
MMESMVARIEDHHYHHHTTTKKAAIDRLIHVFMDREYISDKIIDSGLRNTVEGLLSGRK